MNTDVKQGPMTELKASPYAAQARLDAQRQMLEQDMSGTLSEGAAHPSEMGSSTLAKRDPHKQHIMELYAEKDQLVQQLRAEPRTNVHDGLLIGSMVGLGASYSVHELGSATKHAQDIMGSLLQGLKRNAQGFVTQEDGTIAGLDMFREKLSDHLGADAVGKMSNDDLTGFIQKASNYLNPKKITETLTKQMPGIIPSGVEVKLTENQVNALAKRINKLAEQALSDLPQDASSEQISEVIKGLNEECTKNINGVLKGLPIPEDQMGQVVSKAKDILEDTVTKTHELHHTGIGGDILEQAQANVDQGWASKFTQQTIGKIPNVAQDAFRQTAETLHSGKLHEKALIVGGIVAFTAGVAVLVNHFMNRGKNDKHNALEGEVAKLDRRIASEQEFFIEGMAR